MGFYCTFALIIANSLFPFVLLLNSSFMNEHNILVTLVPVHFPLMQFIVFHIAKS